MENVSEVWKDPKERFCQGDLISISELHQDFKQVNLSVTDYYTDLVLLEELENYRPSSNCEVQCIRDAARNAI